MRLDRKCLGRRISAERVLRCRPLIDQAREWIAQHPAADVIGDHPQSPRPRRCILRPTEQAKRRRQPQGIDIAPEVQRHGLRPAPRVRRVGPGKATAEHHDAGLLVGNDHPMRVGPAQVSATGGQAITGLICVIAYRGF
ncbi:hypothetical protein PCLA_13f0027 [Pseudomonas citronellolis]|nr:hypothetical protein PCLA_13f0027 [Pseudomonas citronellolis]